MEVFVIFMILFEICFASNCKTGEFFDKGVCKKCTPYCGGGQIRIKECSSFEDIKCICPDEKFYDHNILLCRGCTKCTNNQIVVQKCTHEHDRNCTTCPSQHFVLANKCRICTQCQEGQVVHRACKGNRDTVCGRPPTEKWTELTIPDKTHVDQLPTEPTTSEIHQNTNNAVTLTGGILGTVLLLIIIVIVFYTINKICGGTRSKKSEQTSYSEVNVSENDTIVNKKAITEDPGTMMRDVNPIIIENLSRLLNPPSQRNWKQMAALMNFTQIDIQNFGLNKDEATQKVIEAYCTMRESTVYRLYNIFVKMSREDCAEILEQVLIQDNCV